MREWATDQVDGESEVNLSELATAAFEHFHDDRELQRLMFEDSRSIFYDLVQDMAGRTREFAGIRIVSPADAAAHTSISVFAKWLEHAGERHVLLLEMTKEDLQAAQAERLQRAGHETRLAMLWGQLAGKLKKGEKVRDRWSLAEIEQHYAVLSDKTE